MDEASSQGNTVPLRQDEFQIVPPLLLTPSCGGQRADLGEKREPRETVYDNCTKANEQWRRGLTRYPRDREVLPQGCLHEVCPGEVCPAEVCPAEVCPAEVCPAEVCPA